MRAMLRKLILLLCAIGAYVIGFQPTWWVRDTALEAFGSPAYEGVWILIPHVLLYTTLSALTCLVLWLVLIRARWLEPMPFAISRSVLIWGVAAGVLSAAVTFGFVILRMPGALHAPQIDPWLAGANIFSNFYEEFVFRGFLLAALTAVFGFWPAAIISSLAFGAVHAQYPLELQALIAACGVIWCWVVRRTRSIWAAWIAHMALDWLTDPFL
jgi:membrane protease YdiL (CAAX protease family)